MDVVNAGMNQLWLRTVQIVTGIVLTIAVLIILLVTRWGHVKLRRKDYEILCRDELFQKLSQNVDDVFLMLDAKTYKADYISPNMERLLGLTRESVRENINTLALLHPKDFPDRTKNLSGRACGRRTARMGHGVCTSENRGTALVPCGCHGQRGRGTNQVHFGFV